MKKEAKGEALMRSFKVIIEKDEAGYYIADIPELKGCHTQAKNKKVLMQRVREVIELCLEDETEIREVDVIDIEVPISPLSFPA